MKELIMHFQGALILFGIILYFVIAGIIGYFVTDYQNISLRVFKSTGDISECLQTIFSNYDVKGIDLVPTQFDEHCILQYFIMVKI